VPATDRRQYGTLRSKGTPRCRESSGTSTSSARWPVGIACLAEMAEEQQSRPLHFLCVAVLPPSASSIGSTSSTCYGLGWWRTARPRLQGSLRLPLALLLALHQQQVRHDSRRGLPLHHALPPSSRPARSPSTAPARPPSRSPPSSLLRREGDGRRQRRVLASDAAVLRSLVLHALLLAPPPRHPAARPASSLPLPALSASPWPFRPEQRGGRDGAWPVLAAWTARPSLPSGLRPSTRPDSELPRGVVLEWCGSAVVAGWYHPAV